MLPVLVAPALLLPVLCAAPANKLQSVAALTCWLPPAICVCDVIANELATSCADLASYWLAAWLAWRGLIRRRSGSSVAMDADADAGVDVQRAQAWPESGSRGSPPMCVFAPRGSLRCGSLPAKSWPARALMSVSSQKAAPGVGAVFVFAGSGFTRANVRTKSARFTGARGIRCLMILTFARWVRSGLELWRIVSC